MYYDNPLLIVARDQLGVDHICLLTNMDDSSDCYLCVPVSRGRLNLLRAGELDLRYIFETPETGEFYEGRAVEQDLSNIETRAISKSDVPEDWLPEAGVFLYTHRTDNFVIQEALERQRAVIHCTLSPPESLEESKITADHLSDAVRLFQRLIRHTYDKSLRERGILRQDDRQKAEAPPNYTLEVFATSPGSFTLHMQTAAPVDMLGYANISRAMEIIDSISQDMDDQQLVVQSLSEYGGHLVTAYKDLLQFVIYTNTSFAYEWAMPSKRESTQVKIVPRLAKPLYEAIVEKIELGKEEISLTGRFTKIDKDSRKWRLVADDGKRYTGDSYIDLGGTTIETVRYGINCEEVLETEPVTGRDRKKLYLISYDVL
ncbi:MAG: DUF6575 domain-containing protein [Chloroflexota bacterium]